MPRTHTWKPLWPLSHQPYFFLRICAPFLPSIPSFSDLCLFERPKLPVSAIWRKGNHVHNRCIFCLANSSSRLEKEPVQHLDFFLKRYMLSSSLGSPKREGTQRQGITHTKGVSHSWIGPSCPVLVAQKAGGDPTTWPMYPDWKQAQNRRNGWSDLLGAATKRPRGSSSLQKQLHVILLRILRCAILGSFCGTLVTFDGTSRFNYYVFFFLETSVSIVPACPSFLSKYLEYVP